MKQKDWSFREVNGKESDLKRSPGEVVNGGPFEQPTVVVLNNSLNPRLLQHHFRDPHSVGSYLKVLPSFHFSPRQLSSVEAVPFQQRLPNSLGLLFAEQIFYVFDVLYFLFLGRLPSPLRLSLRRRCCSFSCCFWIGNNNNCIPHILLASAATLAPGPVRNHDVDFNYT